MHDACMGDLCFRGKGPVSPIQRTSSVFRTSCIILCQHFIGVTKLSPEPS